MTLLPQPLPVSTLAVFDSYEAAETELCTVSVREVSEVQPATIPQETETATPWETVGAVVLSSLASSVGTLSFLVSLFPVQF